MELFAFDDAYVRRLRDGDCGTEAHFVRYFQQLLLIKLRTRVGSLSEIDDLRQEVFVRVLRSLRAPDGLRDGRKLGSFVNSVCNNVLMEWYRGGKRTEPLEDSHASIADDTDLEQAFATAESKRRIRQVLDGMPERDAALLRGIFLEEKEKDELCADYGVDRDYLRVLLHRAKEKFRAGYSN
jgi:RNA polymerase sigma-70 factor, ECF subfamily